MWEGGRGRGRSVGGGGWVGENGWEEFDIHSPSSVEVASSKGRSTVSKLGVCEREFPPVFSVVDNGGDDDDDDNDTNNR